MLFTGSAFADSATVLKFDGNVTVNGKKIKAGAKIAVGSEVIARGEKSYIDIKMGDDTVKLKDGKLIINNLKNTDRTIDLIKGVLFARIKKKIMDKSKSKERRFRVRTKTAVMGVR